MSDHPTTPTTETAFRRLLADLFSHPPDDLKQAARRDGIDDTVIAQIAMELRGGKTDA
jgi:hypothetical protein